MPVTSRRAFLLLPIDGLPAPSGVRLRMGWLPAPIRVAAIEDAYALVVEEEGPDGRVFEQPVQPAIGEALFRAAAGGHLTMKLADAGPWGIKRYEGPLWGLTLATLEHAEARDAEIPPAPAGWRLGADVTTDPRFQDVALAALSPEEAREFLTAIGAHP